MILPVRTKSQQIISTLGSLAFSPLRKASKVVDIPLPTEFFSGRSKDLNVIATAFELPKTSIGLKRRKIFVLHGTGGMGKTQMALKFVHEYLDRYACLWVLFISFLIFYSVHHARVDI